MVYGVEDFKGRVFVIKRSPIRKVRSKPRRGRLKGAALIKLRDDCFLRDAGICQKCGNQTDPDAPHENDNAYHMAHRKGKRMWGDHLDQVEVECGACHRKFHAYGPSMIKPCNPK
jgi:5-methylcytosine-specific restriction endonuclease McrA